MLPEAKRRGEEQAPPATIAARKPEMYQATATTTPRISSHGAFVRIPWSGFRTPNEKASLIALVTPTKVT